MKDIEKDLEDNKSEMSLKEKEALEFYNYLKKNGCILFETVVGSQAHGTNTPESDVDKAFVYILPQEHIYGTEYREQLRVDKDYTGFEIRRFLELAGANNPNILELFYSPEDCIIYKHPVFDYAIEIRDQILTKRCRYSFAGYAKTQIQKSKGLSKKQNWEHDRFEKKEPIDFCFVIDETGYKTITLTELLEKNELDQKFCGVTKIPNARDNYALFYDTLSFLCFSEMVPKEERDKLKEELKLAGKSMGLGYKGITKNGSGNYAESHQLRLSSIPKGEEALAVVIYNKDSYTKHCKDYKSYQEWLENRNEQRYVDNKEHDQKYDSKNLMHCVRLLEIAEEIAVQGTINIRRPNRERLMDIRKGNVDLNEIITWAENKVIELDTVFDNSSLEDDVDKDLINKTLIRIRKDFYDGNFEDEGVNKSSNAVETFEGFSEFQTMLRNWFLKTLPNPYYESSNDFFCETVSHEKTEGNEYFNRGGYVKLENILPVHNILYIDNLGDSNLVKPFAVEILKTERDRLTMRCRDMVTLNKHTFELVKHGEFFAVINERKVSRDENSKSIPLGRLLEELEISVK